MQVQVNTLEPCTDLEHRQLYTTIIAGQNGLHGVIPTSPDIQRRKQERYIDTKFRRRKDGDVRFEEKAKQAITI